MLQLDGLLGKEEKGSYEWLHRDIGNESRFDTAYTGMNCRTQINDDVMMNK